MTTDCIVFDLDDTLFLERDYVRSGFRAVDLWIEEKATVKGFFEEAWSLFEGGVRGTIFDEALDACGVDPSRELIQEMVSIYREHEPEIRLLEDAEAFLRDVPPNLGLAVVTDGPFASQRAKFNALGLATTIDPVIFTEELGAGFGKPHPRAFEVVQAIKNTLGESCVYVADNPIKDFLAPKSLGWRTVRVRRDGALHSRLESGPDVDAELEDLTRLSEALAITLSGDPIR